MVLKTPSVCIGYNFEFDSVGLQYLVDVNKRRLFGKSRDSKLFTFRRIGINNNYPELLQLLDTILESMEHSGLTQYWQKIRMRTDERLGQENALIFSKTKNYYLGAMSKVDSDSRIFILLLIEMSLIGNIIALLVFALEILRVWYMRRKLFNDLVRPFSLAILP
ncbi:unnamed protein product, partial [Allacma fusca]